MNYETWHKYFDEDPEEEIGRNVKGIFGEDLLVVLPRISWTYLDWLERNAKVDVQRFFRDCEALRTPDYGCHHKVYQNTVYKNFLERERDGLARPEWCDPAPAMDLVDI
ncbi:hypothetical protein [Pseudophaeobacter sp.]|uniref:hypothetical protein n=1 Tax=Pseudophaeobacter sp. TaxID=1971739 RepID=UPI003298486C